MFASESKNLKADPEELAGGTIEQEMLPPAEQRTISYDPSFRIKNGASLKGSAHGSARGGNESGSYASAAANAAERLLKHNRMQEHMAILKKKATLAEGSPQLRKGAAKEPVSMWDVLCAHDTIKFEQEEEIRRQLRYGIHSYH